MIVYVLLLLLSYISLLIHKKTKEKIFSVIPYILMTLVCGLRFEVGRDYNTYLKYFDEIVRDFNFDVEIGYRVVVWIVNRIGGTQQLVFLIMDIGRRVTSDRRSNERFPSPYPRDQKRKPGCEAACFFPSPVLPSE